MTRLVLLVTYIHLTFLTYVTPDTLGVHHGIACDVTEPWHCEATYHQELGSSREILRFKYGTRESYHDVIGNVIRADDLDNNDVFTRRCDSAKTEFKISKHTYSRLDKHRCYELTLREQCLSTDQLCLDTSNAFWYGGAELHNQRWPLNSVQMADQPYVSNDFVSFTTSFGNIIERSWVNSRGIALFINETVPLNVALKENQICFRAKYSKHVKNINSVDPVLNITLCDTENVKNAFELITEMFVDKIGGIPDKRMFKSPIWSTWAKYKTAINEETVLSYADEIVNNGFSNSQLEIDDMYSSTYGDLDFDSTKFENASRMISNLKSKGFRVTVWITPFANLDSEAFQIGMKHSYWLDSPEGTPALVKWWQGIGGVLDVTNKEAVDWFTERLNRMQDIYGVDSFKFDAGETSYLPSQCRPKVPWADSTTYATKYVAAVSQMGPMIEVRCGFRSQEHPVFFRMADKESRWGYENGLKTLIPTILTLGIIGYPYVLPDMIGGNGYDYDTDPENPFITTLIPERELFIRWLQVTSYLPAMQFSFVPWQYDDEVVEIAKRYVKIHEDVVTPLVLNAAFESVSHGTPIIRPLWWLDPDDVNALESDSEFLVGDSLLVAPILDKGATERDIYIPRGKWEDRLRGDSFKGGIWLRNYKIGLDEIATFWLIKKQ